MKQKRGFSLLELAVVVLVIGIITAGIMKATSMIHSSRLSAARSITENSHIQEITGMIAWYETSMPESLERSQTSDTSPITIWRDISPDSIAQNKNILSRALSNTEVTYKTDGINNIPSLQFISSGSLYLNNFFQGSLGQATIFLVVKPTIATSSGAKSTILDSGPLSTTSAISIGDVDASLDLGSLQTTERSRNAANFDCEQNYIIATYFDGNNSRIFVNNSYAIAGDSNLSAGNNPLNGLTIGANKNSSNNFTGLISEVIIYDRPLTIEERKIVMTYLSKKYKIQVTGI